VVCQIFARTRAVTSFATLFLVFILYYASAKAAPATERNEEAYRADPQTVPVWAIKGSPVEQPCGFMFVSPLPTAKAVGYKQ